MDFCKYEAARYVNLLVESASKVGFVHVSHA